VLTLSDSGVAAVPEFADHGREQIRFESSAARSAASHPREASEHLAASSLILCTRSSWLPSLL